MSANINSKGSMNLGGGAQFWVYISPDNNTDQVIPIWRVTFSQGNWSESISSDDPSKQIQTENLSGIFDLKVELFSGSTNTWRQIPPQTGGSYKIGCHSNCASMVGIVADSTTPLPGSINAHFWTTWDAMCSASPANFNKNSLELKTIDLSLPISNVYTQDRLQLKQQKAFLQMELKEGSHIINSSSVEIGNYYDYKIYANISIPYSYDSELQFVTIAGPNDIGDQQIKIVTSLDSNPETTDIHRLNNKGFVTESSTNLWTDFIEKSPNVRQVTKIAIRQSIETLVQQLLDAGVQGVIQTDTPPVVKPSNYNDYKNMFMPNKEDVSQPTLQDILQVQTAVNSTYYGTITWTLMYSFANIIGSTSDPKPSGYSSWITLWNDKCHGGSYTTQCSSHNYSNGKSGFVCGSDFVGGHVIPGTTAKSVATGGTAYIFPICKAHNNNDNIYMSSRYNPKGVVLKNYNK